MVRSLGRAASCSVARDTPKRRGLKQVSRPLAMQPLIVARDTPKRRGLKQTSASFYSSSALWSRATPRREGD